MTDAKVSTAEPVKLTRTQRMIAEAGSKKRAPETRIKIKPNKKLNIPSVDILDMKSYPHQLENN